MDHLLLSTVRAPTCSEVSLPSLNLDVRKRGVDPFFSGIAVGAMATLIGIGLGLCFWAI